MERENDEEDLEGFMLEQLFRDIMRVPTIEEINISSKEDLIKVQSCGCTCLRHAVKNRADPDVVRLLIERAPEALAITNKKGNVVLSSIKNDTIAEVGRLVSEQTPTSALLQLDSDGDLPLHCIIQNKASDEVLKLVVQRCPPEVFSTANNLGKLPVHEAVWHGMDPSTFSLLLDRSPANAMGIPDKKGRLPIHYFSARTSQEVAEIVTRRSPKGSLALRDLDGRLPIHCAVEGGILLQALQVLIETSPIGAMYCQDKNGQLPLHFIGPRLSTDALRALICHSHRDALMTRDSDGRLPIHCALERHSLANTRRRSSADMLTHLINQLTEESLSVADNKGRTPLHTAIEHMVSTEVIELLVQRASQDSMAKADEKGRIPVFVAVMFLRYTLELVRLLVSKTPHKALLRRDKTGETLMHHLAKGSGQDDIFRHMAETTPKLLAIPDASGQLPSHYVVQNTQSFEEIQFLVAFSPESFLTPDADLRLPLHHIGSHTSMEVVKVLVKHPSIRRMLGSADKNGSLPLHQAIKNKLSVESIELLADHGPEAMTCFDNDGHLALCYALASNRRRVRRVSSAWRLGIVKLLTGLCPDMLLMRDPHGQLLLHDAVELGVPTEVLALFVNACPEAAKIADGNGRVPLHSAAGSILPWESFRVILNSFPGGVCVSDASGEIPLFVACGEDSSLNKIYALLRLNPSALVLNHEKQEGYQPPSKKAKT